MVLRKQRQASAWVCDGCGSSAATLIHLKQASAARARLLDTWQAARRKAVDDGRACPACTHPMCLVGAAGEDARAVELDVCRRCQVLWFDAGELEVFLPPRKVEHDPNLGVPMEDRVQLALEKARRESERVAGSWGQLPAGWQWLPALFGMPWEHDVRAVQVRPLATWAIAVAVAAVSVAAFFDLENVVAAWGLVPSELGRKGGTTLLTSFFLHGGWFHLLANLYFLIVFGDNVEEELGPIRFLSLLFAATLLGGLAHALGDVHSTVPCVGASGGISGVLAFYALRFPRAKVAVFWLIGFIPLTFRIPVLVAFGIWVLLQLITVYQQASGLTNVSGLAHLGGAIAGVGLWFAWRSSLRMPS